MRITKLRRIKLRLDQVVKGKGYFIYVAPLLKEHYQQFIELICTKNCGSENLMTELTKENLLLETVPDIDVRTEILIDTNLYVSRLGTNDIDLGHELIDFLTQMEINYKFIIADDELIRALENKPEDTLNE